MSGSPLKKRLLINAVLFAVVTALLLAVWLSPEQQQQKHLSAVLDADSIDRIRIVGKGRQPVVMHKAGNYWQLTEPVNAPASPFRVNSILNITLTTSHADYALSDIDPLELGLATPDAVLYLNDFKISFGTRDPIDQRRYTEFNQRVYLLDDYTLPLLTQPLTSLIDTRLLPEQLRVTAFQLPDFRIVQTTEGGWQIEPENANPDPVAIQEWVDRWHRQRAAEVRYQPQLDLDNAVPVVLEIADREPLNLLILNNKTFSGIYNVKQKLAYAISTASLELLQAQPVTTGQGAQDTSDI